MKDEKDDTISINSLPAVEKLTLKQRDMITAYIDKDNKDTYSNKTNSYVSAYGRKSSRAVEYTEAYQEFKKPRVRTAVNDILDSLGYGRLVRLSQLSKIGQGQYVSHSKKSVYSLNELGVPTLQRIEEYESNPSADSIIKVNDMIAKLTGEYTLAAEQSKSYSKRLDKLYKRISDQIDVTEQRSVQSTEQRSESTD